MRRQNLKGLLLLVWNLKLHVSGHMIADVKDGLDSDLNVPFCGRLDYFVIEKLFLGMRAANRFKRRDTLPYPADAFENDVGVNQGCCLRESLSSGMPEKDSASVVSRDTG